MSWSSFETLPAQSGPFSSNRRDPRCPRAPGPECHAGSGDCLIRSRDELCAASTSCAAVEAITQGTGGRRSPALRIRVNAAAPNVRRGIAICRGWGGHFDSTRAWLQVVK